MTDLFQEPDNATPLDPALRDDLLQTWITTRNDLNEAEQDNIVKGAAWARRRRGAASADLLSVEFSSSLHKQMYGDVWKWAGSQRQTEVTIEATMPPHQIAAELPMLFDNARFWLKEKTYSNDEIAARLHHRLTQIHPFPDGNGRHARMMADLLLERLGEKPFSWGSGNLKDAGTLREQYVAALRAADGHDFGPLVKFARS